MQLQKIHFVATVWCVVIGFLQCLSGATEDSYREYKISAMASPLAFSCSTKCPGASSNSKKVSPVTAKPKGPSLNFSISAAILSKPPKGLDVQPQGSVIPLRPVINPSWI